MGLSHAGRVDSATPRRASLEDAPAVAEVLLRSRRAAVDAIPPAVHSDAEVRDWIRTVVIPEREVWLAEDADGRPLGVLVLDGEWVDQLYIEPAFTGMGLGSRLIQLAKSRRPAGLQLWTFVTNTAAQRFYLRHGFTVAETTDGSGNEEKAPDIRFIWAAL
ncbi:N-acetyltransferase [Pilimelia terevasa]|uniref:N-acetyltransferase n=1 Tax=Pilimelia terevasa TaxID=53372 RepID=A0A8J3FL30_9ACTN|nr:N-acetyltransferase [Pilimelia terevasa]